MSQAAPVAVASPGPAHHMMRTVFVLAVLMGLAMIGMASANAFSRNGWWTWIAIVAAYGIVCAWLVVRDARARHAPLTPLLWRCLLHWLGLLVALKVIFVAERMGFVTKIAVGDVAILMLALACYFAGVHFNWVFIIIALFLIEMAYLNAYLNEYLWILLIASAVLLLAAVFLLIVMRRRALERKAVAKA